MTEIDPLHRLTSIEDIKQLKAQYCAYCDDNYDPDGIAGQFTEDAIWDGEFFGRYVGRDQIRSHFRRVSGEIVFAAHFVLNPIIELDTPDTATGRWRLLMPSTVMTDGAKEARWLLGSYRDDYRRVDGKWLFSHVRCHFNFYTPHLGTWAETAVP